MVYVLYVALPDKAGDTKFFGHHGEKTEEARSRADVYFDLMVEQFPTATVELFDSHGGPPIRRANPRGRT